MNEKCCSNKGHCHNTYYGNVEVSCRVKGPLMQFVIDIAIFERFPELTVGLLIVRGASNVGSPPEIANLLRGAEAKVRLQFPDPEALKRDPRIAAWQAAHRLFGSNPNKFPPSLQASVKRVVKGGPARPNEFGHSGGQLPSINPLVDLYNVISLRHMVTVGGEDIDQCSGDIRLTLAEGSEPFIELDSSEHTPPDPGEVIYRDDLGVICRRFNWREGERTKLTESTRNAVLVIEGLPPTSREDIQKALQELQELVQRFCGGTGTLHLITKNTPSYEL